MRKSTLLPAAGVEIGLVLRCATAVTVAGFPLAGLGELPGVQVDPSDVGVQDLDEPVDAGLEVQSAYSSQAARQRRVLRTLIQNLCGTSPLRFILGSDISLTG